MTLFLDDGDVRLYHGDVLQVLRQLPTGIAQTCVTSPPFYGLRDYGTGSWSGGDPTCDHTRPRSRRDGAGRPRPDLSDPPASWAERDSRVTTAYVKCECGARRVDDQIGLESTIHEYVQRIVQVFAEAWRVLRPDGTLWLELGSSFASASTGPSRSRQRPRAQPYGSDDTARPDSPDPGSAYRDFCDGCRDATLTHPAHTERTDQLPGRDGPQPSPTIRGTEPTDSLPASLDASPPDAPASSTPAPSLAHPVGCSHCPMCGGCLAVLNSSPRDARLCARRDGPPYMLGNESNGHPLARHNQGTEVSGTAWIEYIERGLKAKDLIPVPYETGANNWDGAGLPRLNKEVTTTGWRASCTCNVATRPQLVLDPFCGSGTTNLVARNHARRSIGIDLSSAYLEIAARRLAQQSLLSGGVS